MWLLVLICVLHASAFRVLPRNNLASREYVAGSILQSRLFSDTENDVMEASKSVTEASNSVKALMDELRKWKELNPAYTGTEVKYEILIKELDSARAALEKREDALEKRKREDALEKRQVALGRYY